MSKVAVDPTPSIRDHYLDLRSRGVNPMTSSYAVTEAEAFVLATKALERLKKCHHPAAADLEMDMQWYQHTKDREVLGKMLEGTTVFGIPISLCGLEEMPKPKNHKVKKSEWNQKLDEE